MSYLLLYTQEQDECHAIHRERKLNLREGRLLMLRNCLQRGYGNDWLGDSVQEDELEAILDDILIEYDYDLELAIDDYRNIAPELEIINPLCKCGYMPPFCVCSIRP